MRQLPHLVLLSALGHVSYRIGQLLSRSTTEHPQTFSMNGSVVGRGSLEFLKYRGRDEQRPDGVEAGPGAVCAGRSGYRRRWKFCKASK